MSGSNSQRSRDMQATWGPAAVGVLAATCLGIAAARDTLSAVNPFYFSHAQDRGTRAVSDASDGADVIPSTQLPVDNGAGAPLYAEARFAAQPSSELAPSFLSPGFDRNTPPARVESEAVDEERSVEPGQVPASGVSETGAAADETGQSMERDAVAEQDAADTSSDPSVSRDPTNSVAVEFSAATDR